MPFYFFRFMDITGPQAFYHVMKDLFPTLINQLTVPGLIPAHLNGGKLLSIHLSLCRQVRLGLV